MEIEFEMFCVSFLPWDRGGAPLLDDFCCPAGWLITCTTRRESSSCAEALTEGNLSASSWPQAISCCASFSISSSLRLFFQTCSLMFLSEFLRAVQVDDTHSLSLSLFIIAVSSSKHKHVQKTYGSSFWPKMLISNQMFSSPSFYFFYSYLLVIVTVWHFLCHNISILQFFFFFFFYSR